MGNLLKDMGTVVGWADEHENKYVYVTITGQNGEDPGFYLTGRAPATEIHIVDEADISLNKALGGDLLVYSFGRRPVYINIRGLDLYKIPSCDSGGGGEESPLDAASARRIQFFWAMNNVDNNPAARALVSIEGAFTTYLCVLTTLRSSADNSDSDTPGIGTYELRFVGVPLT